MSAVVAFGWQRRVRVGEEEARAIAEALTAEVRGEAFPVRMSSQYFDRERLPLLHRARKQPRSALHVLASVTSYAPERVLVEVVERSGRAVETQRVEVSREALRQALRLHAASELLPALPTGLIPAMRATYLRQRFAREHWEVRLDRALAFKFDGFPAVRESGVVLTVSWWNSKPPDWLAHLPDGFAAYDPYATGMSELLQVTGAPRPSAHSRLGDWAGALEA